MPLLPGTSSDVISKNVAELIRAGHEPDQAVAIAHAVARRHRRDAKAKRKKVPATLPRQIPPKAIESSYAARLVKGVIVPAKKAYAPVIAEVKRLTAEAKKAKTDRTDAAEVTQKLRALLAKAAREMGRALSTFQLDALARKFAQQTATYQRIQLHRQVRGTLGANPLTHDIGLSERISTFVRHNVSLVKRIPQRLHGDLSDLVEEGARGAWTTPDLAEAIASRFGVAERHARLIARDQVGSLYADVNHARQRELGVEKFVWRTVHDERVRGDPDGKYPNAMPSHFDLDGQVFSYDDPPQPEGADEPILPGDDINCRCYAEPVLDDLIGEDEEGDDEGDGLAYPDEYEPGDEDDEGEEVGDDEIDEEDRGDSADRLDFDPDEPRDEHGMWTEGGGAGAASAKEPAGAKAPKLYEQTRASYAEKGVDWDAMEKMSDDERTKLFEEMRVKKAEWDHSVDLALASGELDIKTAEKLGYYWASGKVGPLPQELYHVTTAATAVEREGLKTRDELNQQNGVGLGGGTSNTISFTTSPKIAADIELGIREMRKCARGELTIDMMMDRAKAGSDAKRPYDADIRQIVSRENFTNKVTVDGNLGGEGPSKDAFYEWKGGEKIPNAFKSSDFRPVGEPFGANKDRYMKWERDATPQEMADRRVAVFKAMSMARETAGGPEDPLFFMSDTNALAKIPESEIKTLRFEPKPGAQGYQVSALGEWRTWSGTAVKQVPDAK